MTTEPLHPEFAALEPSWELALRAHGFADNSVKTYLAGFRSLAGWAAENRPGGGPLELARGDLRAWLVWLRERGTASTAQSRFSGARSFYAWAVDEGEIDESPAAGLTAPKAEDPVTEVLTVDQLQALLASCSGRNLQDRRDNAIIRVFADCGLRLAENTGLEVDDVDLSARVVFVVGKGSGRAGPRRRAVPFGVRTAQALDRYLRERRKVPGAEVEHGLWLASTGRRMAPRGIQTMINRRGAAAGMPELHPHSLRHTWAHAFRAAGGGEGDLMLLGGWRSRSMLDRYGSSMASERAQDAYRQRSLGDKL